jgi:hypothetical protein
MRKLLVALSLGGMLLFSNSVFSQTTTAAKPSRDTIFTLTRDTLLVSVTSVSSMKVYYSNPDSNNIERTIPRKTVQRIVYTSGKVEVLNKPVFLNVAATDWRSIIITDNPSDVEGMHLRAIIIGKSASNVTTGIGAKNSAEVMAKKKAAANGGMYALVKERKELGGYGETPKYYMECEVYGTAPLENGQEPKDEIKKAKQKKRIL